MAQPDLFNTGLVLEDDRVILRKLQEDDLDKLLHFAIEEPEIWKYSLVRADSPENMRRYISIGLEAADKGIELPFIVYDKHYNQYAGSTRFYEINKEYQTVQIGYTWYGSHFYGTGLNKHCKYLMLSYAFEVAGMKRVEFRADANNSRSIAAMKSIGCRAEGILRSNMPTFGSDQRRDTIVLSILGDEWHAGVKELIKKQL